MKKGKKVPRRRRTVEQKHMPGYRHKVETKYNRQIKHRNKDDEGV